MLLRIGGTLPTPVPRHRSSHLTSVNFLSTHLARLRDLERCLQRWNFHVSKSYLSITSALWPTNRGIPLRSDARHVRYLLNATMPSRMPLPRRYDRGVKSAGLIARGLQAQPQQTNPASAELFRAGSRNNVLIEAFASSPTLRWISGDAAAPHLERLSPPFTRFMPDPPLSSDEPVGAHLIPPA